MKICVAGTSMDAQLKKLMAETPMPGWIKVAYCREPSFFEALAVEGKHNQVVAVLEEDDLAGMGCRCTKPVYVDGRQAEFGYLGGLRFRESARGGMGLIRGFRFFRELHADARVPAYITTVMEANRIAVNVLTAGRAGMPHYIDSGRYTTYAISTSAVRKVELRWRVVRGTEMMLPAICRFLNEEGCRRQFFPVISVDDFGSGYLRNLAASDFLVAVDGDAIAGVLAVWNQNGFKQNRVVGYSRTVGLLRRPLNTGLRMAGFSPLPEPGSDLNVLYASFICIAGDNVPVLGDLLRAAHAMHAGSGVHYLLAGFHERDPLSAALRGFRYFEYRSRLYLVCWEDGLGTVNKLDRRRIPYLDPATL